MPHVSWFQARQLAFEAAASSLRRSSRLLPLGQALGATLAEDVFSPLPLPHYDSSAMDGFALAGPGPWLLRWPPAPESSHANVHRLALELESGQATPLLTGGLIPPGTTSVLRSEYSRVEGDYLYALEEVPAAGRDIRRAGEELVAGSLLLARGSRLTARALGLLAVAGLDEVQVCTRPSFACALTGNEVIQSGLPGPGQVRDAYAFQFPALLSQLGAGQVEVVRLHDDWDEVDAFFAGAEADFLLATGGSANSEVDILRRYLVEAGADFIFESVAMRPGHPTLLARLADGRLVLGLPGNPLAAYTAFYSFLPALLAGWNGYALAEPETVVSTSEVAGFDRSSLRLLPCRVEAGQARVATRATSSHMLSALVEANALALVEPQGLVPGQQVRVIPLFDG